MGKNEGTVSLGDRMKGQYEHRTRYMLPRRTYTIIRVDGKAFHSYTKAAKKPFDNNILISMMAGAHQVMKEIQGARFAYIQSDECSFLLADFDKAKTQAWFDGNLQKLVSVSASAFTAGFNVDAAIHFGAPATFDSRAFTIPDPVEVENYFLWRQRDWERNSIQMLALTHFSPKQLHRKNHSDIHEMLHGKGVNWADLPMVWKNGYLINPYGSGGPAFDFGRERDHLTSLIPKHGYDME